jgi:hypothetical protein
MTRKSNAPKPKPVSHCMACGSKMLALHGLDAAAPELLAALQMAIHQMEQMRGMFRESEDQTMEETLADGRALLASLEKALRLYKGLP